MRELSLFTGAGGGLLGSKLLDWRTIGYVEVNDYCQRVIAQRIKDGILDDAPIYGDIRTFISEGYAGAYKGLVDIVTGGFPCQPFSTASRGRRTAEDFWPYMLSTVKAVQPKYVFAENVSEKAIITACIDLSMEGYSLKYIPLAASDMGADHVRRRFWLLAYANDEGKLSGQLNAEVEVLQEFCNRIWEVFPRESRVVDGVANRMDRFKAIGNGQVPLVVVGAWQTLRIVE